MKSYAGCVGPGCSRIVLVEVDPADIVSVPYDCSCGKVRCSTYKVVAEYQGELAGYAGAGLKSALVDVNAAAARVLQEMEDDYAQTVRNSGRCSVCGSEVEDDHRFCPECGTEL